MRSSAAILHIGSKSTEPRFIPSNNRASEWRRDEKGVCRRIVTGKGNELEDMFRERDPESSPTVLSKLRVAPANDDPELIQ